MSLPFKEFPIGKFACRFYKTDHVWTCTMTEDMLDEIIKLTKTNHTYNPFAVPHFVLNPPNQLPVTIKESE
jgi:hypothetical protein